MRDHGLSVNRSSFGHIAAVVRGSAFAGCVLGAVLFIWSATSLRHDLTVGSMTRAAVLSAPALPSLPRIVTFADLSRHLPRVPVRDVIRLAWQ